MNLKYGILTISLDFELYWGVRDKRSIDQYRKNLLGVRKAVDEMLNLFYGNEIHVTWATVGFLFFKDSDQLKRNFPPRIPEYNNNNLSPYQYIESNFLEYDYHFAPDILERIRKQEGQEIGTHTFSHFYCLEESQTVGDFMEDIVSAKKIAESQGIVIRSLVFPRNQWNPEYLPILTRLGICCYRGNESNWLYKASDDASQQKIRRMFRLLDTYLNITGHQTYNLQECTKNVPYNFPSSRFLRPYSKKLSILDGIRLKRITKAMDDAARNNKIFHLWWHPHNFGVNINQNIDFLKRIIDHFQILRQRYGMRSLNMGELCILAGADDDNRQNLSRQNTTEQPIS